MTLPYLRIDRKESLLDDVERADLLDQVRVAKDRLCALMDTLETMAIEERWQDRQQTITRAMVQEITCKLLRLVGSLDIAGRRNFSFIRTQRRR